MALYMDLTFSSKWFIIKNMKILKMNLIFIIFSYLFSIEVSPPIEVTPDSLSAINCRMCIDSTGKVYVFWEQRGGLFFRYFENNTASPPQKFLDATPGGRMSDPVVDKHNRIWFFIEDHGVIYGRYIYGDELSPIIYVPTFPSCNHWPQITCDREGNLWIAWTTCLWGHQPIFTRYYNGYEWSDTFSVCDLNKEVGSWTHHLFTDREGNIWILYETTLYEKEDTLDAILLRKFENGNWKKCYIVNKGNTGSWSDITHTKSEYIVVFPRRIRIKEEWPWLWKFELYALNFLDFSTTYLQKIWEEDSTPTISVYPFLNVDDENRVWLLYSRGVRRLYLQLFDGKWSKPEIIVLNDSFPVFYSGSVYDRFRKRIWFTYDITDTIEHKYRVYLRYIDLSDIPTNYTSTFLFSSNIIRNKNTTMISFMGVSDEIIDMYIYDLTGRKIKDIIRNLNNIPSFYRFYWTPNKFSSGNYFICIDTKEKKKFLKVILIK